MPSLRPLAVLTLGMPLLVGLAACASDDTNEAPGADAGAAGASQAGQAGSSAAGAAGVTSAGGAGGGNAGAAGASGATSGGAAGSGGQSGANAAGTGGATSGGAAGSGGQSGADAAGAAGASGADAAGAAGASGADAAGAAGASGANAGGEGGIGGAAGGEAGSGGAAGAGAIGGGAGSGGGIVCEADTADCDDDPANGCETNTATAVDNCGACGNACAAGSHEEASCAGGVCGTTCATGFADCDGSSATGCETSLQADAAHCGTCSNACAAGGTCTDGACVCTGSITAATLRPFDLLVLLDRSGTMNDQVQGGLTRWKAIGAALQSFVEEPAPGLNVGLQYFPQLTGPGGSASCNAADYTTPALDFTAMPAGAGDVATSFAGYAPNNGAPTWPALSGSIQLVRSHVQSRPDHTAAIVLVTDGPASLCTPSSANDLALLAKSGVSGFPTVRTFVIGVYPLFEASGAQKDLDLISSGGDGVVPAPLITSGDVTAQVKSALDEVRSRLVQCDYQIPDTGSGAPDHGLVNVILTPSGSTAETLKAAPDLASCGADGGWAYDDPTGPTKITLCPAACTKLRSDAANALDISIGCATEKLLPFVIPYLRATHRREPESQATRPITPHALAKRY